MPRIQLAAVTILLSLPFESAYAQCFDVSQDQVQTCCYTIDCVCSGFPGAGCPQEDWQCNKRKLVTGGLYDLTYTPQPCYNSTPCAPENYPGGCHPQTNPCILTGPATPNGSFPKYYRLDICAIGARLDRRFDTAEFANGVHSDQGRLRKRIGELWR
ncbi:hypothetical protein RAS1_02700 [Phycisphaerae bacterium RAS1]|nr:hypothetical protein RAS1_02700 [Phycisphaerae bacterium RAS1]